MTPRSKLASEFGSIDIYLFDQLLRGRIRPGMKVFDAGCGGGRNLVYLLRMADARELEIFASDADPMAVQSVRKLASTLPAENIRHESVEETSFSPDSMDFVISSAVLHFARDEKHFLAMVRAMWKTLRPGGILFARLASSIGIEDQVQPVDGRVCLLPDGSYRFLVDAAMLDDLTARLGGELADPLKTTLVQNQRSMTTWVVRKLDEDRSDAPGF